MTEYLSGAVAACLIICSAMLAVLLVSGYLVPGAWQDQRVAQVATNAPSPLLVSYRQGR
jgi:hypothetical protein